MIFHDFLFIRISLVPPINVELVKMQELMGAKAPSRHAESQSNLAMRELEVCIMIYTLLGCPWYLVNGLVHPFISRLDTSPK